MIRWLFKKNAKPQGSSSGFWFDITDGGYIKPDLLLENRAQIEKLNWAIEVVKSFEEILKKNNF